MYLTHTYARTRGASSGTSKQGRNSCFRFIRFGGILSHMSMLTRRLTAADVAEREAALLRQPLDDASTITVGSVTVEVSDHARAVLAEVLDELAAGHRVDIMPVKEMLSTQEAADMLRVSRPTLVKMLEDGLLPYEQPGVHRRLARAAVDEFLSGQRERRGKALEELAQTHDPSGPDEIVATR